MGGHLDPIAYTYEADYHCECCAVKRFGRTGEYGHIVGTDSEGNEVGIVAPWDEWYANDVFEGKKQAILVCGTCGETIEEVDLEN